MIGTTNSTDLKLGKDGSRRFPIFPIARMDTDKLMRLDHHRFFRRFYQKHYKPALDACTTGLGSCLPWVPSDHLIDFIEKSNRRNLAGFVLEQRIEELFAFEDDQGRAWEPDPIRDGITNIQTAPPGGPLYTLQEIYALLQSSVPRFNYTQAQVKKDLERLLGQLTKTSRTPRYFDTPRCKLFKGRLSARKGRHFRYYLPPKRTSFKKPNLNIV